MKIAENVVDRARAVESSVFLLLHLRINFVANLTKTLKFKSFAEYGVEIGKGGRHADLREGAWFEVALGGRQGEQR